MGGPLCMSYRRAFVAARQGVAITVFGFEEDFPASRRIRAASYLQDARQLWRLVRDFILERPARAPGRAGRPWVSDEDVFVRIVLFLRAGCSWDTFDELSRGSGVSGRTCRRRLAEWRASGVFEQVFEVLRSQLEAPLVAHVRACALQRRPCRTDTARQGSKLQALVNEESLPIAIQLESANPHGIKCAPALLGLVDEMPPTIHCVTTSQNAAASFCRPTGRRAPGRLATKSTSDGTIDSAGASNGSSHGSSAFAGSQPDGKPTRSTTAPGSTSPKASSTSATDCGHDL